MFRVLREHRSENTRGKVAIPVGLEAACPRHEMGLYRKHPTVTDGLRRENEGAITFSAHGSRGEALLRSLKNQGPS
jgi:hypothetical protein